MNIKKKESFEKIKSAIEKKNIFNQLAASCGELICKGSSESLFSFRIDSFVEGQGLSGTVATTGEAPKLGDAIVCNFQIGFDRYFMQSTLVRMGDKYMIVIPEGLFLLQRRAHNRVDLPESVGRSINIIGHNGKVLFLNAECMDISAGGARVIFYGDMATFHVGDHLKLAFHIKNKWRFEAEASVRHIRQEHGYQVLGCQFDVTDKGLSNKLQMMMLELQRWAVLSGTK
ncbi:MAG: hypothetical protein BroJett040_11870 [Oligoflexia bacterium]|nr:MAG: hypothetical protein BroJett040_11870 [Oligoflexia bacterium]